MEQEQTRKFKLTNLLKGACYAAGTFLFVFLMLHEIIIHMSGLYNGAWLVPYFSIPAYLVCVTIGIDYWIAGNRVRNRSYLPSVIVSVVILLCGGAYFMPGYVIYGGFRSLLAALFTAIVIFYSIRHVGQKKVKSSQVVAQEITDGTRGVKGGASVVRIICLLSICCVLFENVQNSIMVVYGFIISLNYGRDLETFSQFPLSILSVILLARFVKAEFVQRDSELS